MRTGFAAGTTVLAVAFVAGCGGDDNTGASGGAARSVEIATVEYAFVAQESITIEAGETIEFIVTNEGEIDHEMEVLTDASRRLGKTDRIEPGASDSLIVTFEDPGVYTVICDIDDHRSRGQVAEFTVFAPGDASS